jgi:hypothetical protein
MRNAQVSTAFRRASNAAEIVDFLFHDLRQTAASWMRYKVPTSLPGRYRRKSDCGTSDFNLLMTFGVPKHSELQPHRFLAKRDGDSAAEFMVIA